MKVKNWHCLHCDKVINYFRDNYTLIWNKKNVTNIRGLHNDDCFVFFDKVQDLKILSSKEFKETFLTYVKQLEFLI